MKSDAERKRDQRERARAAGLCITCCIEPARVGGTKCAGCNAKAYTYVVAARRRKKSQR